MRAPTPEETAASEPLNAAAGAAGTEGARSRGSIHGGDGGEEKWRETAALGVDEEHGQSGRPLGVLPLQIDTNNSAFRAAPPSPQRSTSASSSKEKAPAGGFTIKIDKSVPAEFCAIRLTKESETRLDRSDSVGSITYGASGILELNGELFSGAAEVDDMPGSVVDAATVRSLRAARSSISIGLASTSGGDAERSLTSLSSLSGGSTHASRSPVTTQVNTSDGLESDTLDPAGGGLFLRSPSGSAGFPSPDSGNNDDGRIPSVHVASASGELLPHAQSLPLVGRASLDATARDRESRADSPLFLGAALVGATLAAPGGGLQTRGLRRSRSSRSPPAFAESRAAHRKSFDETEAALFELRAEMRRIDMAVTGAYDPSLAAYDGGEDSFDEEEIFAHAARRSSEEAESTQ